MSAAVQDIEAILGKPHVADAKPVQSDPLENVSWLPCTLTLELPVVHFTIADLLSLEKGSIVETACHHTSDVPLRVNQLLIGWTEFEVTGDRLAVRITEQI
jgi:flagellar motor switch/type III secretory pathway protein FliN